MKGEKSLFTLIIRFKTLSNSFMNQYIFRSSSTSVLEAEAEAEAVEAALF